MISQERQGRLKSWNDDKGFGFIQPQGGGAELFAHISVMRGERRPQVGDEVLYVAGRDAQGRPRAEHMRLAGELSLDRQAIRRKPAPKQTSKASAPCKVAHRGQRANREGPIQHFGAKTLLFVLLCGLPLTGAMLQLRSALWWALPLYFAASLASFLQYWMDKRSAQQGMRRTPENSLHLVELIGGWPGALIAQQTFRHKTRKASYQGVFWLIVAAHQAFWLDLLWFDGAFIARHVPLLIQ
ncbi:conserved membrane hypothetical protein [Pseudomonas sp. 8Z]|uniref:DUF1294 domain-containing protein n=1 Tax=Pseudomonas sp. 8Z TaxID=2653166 RepID=UPI0012EFDFBA|nr:DUF1294 domain-containing protein [Pseudomonas sp. 8Z]VXD00483.1 conserved membrane hypothetical protein [Pseudomonas sp. 8Z]